MTDQAVTNKSQKGLLRLRSDVGIDYDDDPALAAEVAMAAMESVDAVVASPTPQVIPKDFGDSAIELELRYWIDNPNPPRKWRAIGAVIKRVKAGFDEAGIGIPFPQREVSGRDGPPDQVPLSTESATNGSDGADDDGEERSDDDGEERSDDDGEERSGDTDQERSDDTDGS